MRRLVVLLALALCAGPTPVSAQSPEPSAGPPSTPSVLAIAAVRALDPRFADIDDYAHAIRQQAATFDLGPTLASSWIKVLPTFGTEFDLESGRPDMPSWLDPGDRLVEVMLVDDCPDTLQTTPSVDPCGWRQRWLLCGSDAAPSLAAKIQTKA